MCEANAYLLKGETSERIMENVICIEPRENEVFLEDIIGDQMVVKGRLESMRLLDSKVFIRAL